MRRLPAILVAVVCASASSFPRTGDSCVPALYESHRFLSQDLLPRFEASSDQRGHEDLKEYVAVLTTFIDRLVECESYPEGFNPILYGTYLSSILRDTENAALAEEGSVAYRVSVIVVIHLAREATDYSAAYVQ